MFKSLRWAMALLGSIGVMVALAVAAQGYLFIQKLDSSASKVYASKDVVADILPPPMYLIEMRLVLSMMLEGGMGPADGKKRFEELAAEYDQRVDYWKNNPPYGLESKLLGEQHTEAKYFIEAARNNIVQPIIDGRLEIAKSNLPNVHASYMKHRTGVDATVVEGNAFSTAAMSEFENTRSFSNKAMIITALAAAAVVFAIYLITLSSIQKPVQASTQAAALIAAGDLSTHAAIDTERTDSLGVLQQSLQKMRIRLSQMVSSVLSVAENISHASSEISQANTDLSRRTESQASAVQQTALSMEGITSAVKKNTESAIQADQLAQQAADVARRGGTAVAKVVETMRSINESSGQINGIVNLIESIAFQTNILSLNAAVEAARAGEQGRGFAVVASEVRSLAGRSANAAREIKNLIDTSVERVNQGCLLADHAGATMNDLLQATQRVNILLTEISTASREQAEEISQVSNAVSKIDQVTQQNAALVEEMSATASSLRSQASELLEKISVFTFDKEIMDSLPAASRKIA